VNGGVEDLLAIDPDGGLIGLVVELPLEQEPAADGDVASGVIVLAERTVDCGVDKGQLETVVRGRDLFIFIFGKASSSGGQKDGVTVGNAGHDVHIGAAKEVVAQCLGQIFRHEQSVGPLRGRGAADQQGVLAMRHFVLLDGEDAVASDILGPEIPVDGA